MICCSVQITMVKHKMNTMKMVIVATDYVSLVIQILLFTHVLT